MSSRISIAIFLLPSLLYAQEAVVYRGDLRPLIEARSVTIEWPKLDNKNALYLTSWEYRTNFESVYLEIISKRANGICKLLGPQFRVVESASAEAHPPYEQISKVLVDMYSGVPVERPTNGFRLARYVKEGDFIFNFSTDYAIRVFKWVKCAKED